MKDYNWIKDVIGCLLFLTAGMLRDTNVYIGFTPVS